MTTASTTPLPCPFCGCPPKVNINGVECCNRECWAHCMVIIPETRSRAERRRSGETTAAVAIRVWNTRRGAE